MKKRITLATILTLAFLFTGCFSSTIKSRLNFIVDGKVYATVRTDKSSLDTPNDPNKDGYTFDGWFWDKDVWEDPLTLDSLMDTPLSQNLRVYAKFTIINEPEWTNENAVYATVAVETEYVNINVFAKNVEDAFDAFDFKAVYVVEKTSQIPWCSRLIGSLKLLFLLNESDKDKQQEFADLLRADDRIMSASHCYDVPYETIDTAYIEALTDTIAVGDTLTVAKKGYRSVYYQPFVFGEIYVELSNYNPNKTYTAADFPQVKLSSVKKEDWFGRTVFCLGLTETDYYSTIKAADALNRTSAIHEVVFTSIEYNMPPPPIWEISDRTVADFIDYDHDHPDVEGYYCIYCDGGAKIIKGLKVGTTTIGFDGTYLDVTVTDDTRMACCMCGSLDCTGHEVNEYLSPKVKKEIQQSYIDTYLTYISRVVEPEEVRVDYYGTYTTRYDYGCDRESVAVMISFNECANAAMRYETVAGYEFEYTYTGGNFEFFICVWSNGVFYTLTDTYAQGLLTLFDIRLINAFHKGFDIAKWYQIKNDYQQQYGYQMYFDKYLGNHNGYETFFIAGCDTAIWNVKVAGYSFYASTLSDIIVYKDGVFLDFSAAYNQGLLSKQDIANIWYYYQNGIDNPIRFDKYLGTYNGYDILFIVYFSDVVWQVEIAGKTFFASTESSLTACKDGVIYELSYAYSQGFLSEQDIAEIWNNYMGN